MESKNGEGGAVPLDLRKPRDLGEILSTCLNLYMKYFALFASLAIGVVVPIDFAVYGLGEGLLWSGYDEDPSIAITLITFLVPVLVTTPLVTATHVHAVRALGEGNAPPLNEAFDTGLRLLPPVAWVVALSVLGTLGGLIALIVPGVYLFVRWYVAVQTAVVEGARGGDALKRSRGPCNFSPRS